MAVNEQLKPLLDNAPYVAEAERNNSKTIIFSVLITAIVFSALTFFWQNFNQKNKNAEISQLSSQVATLSSQLAVLQAGLTTSKPIEDDQNTSAKTETDNAVTSRTNREYVEPVNLMPALKGAFAYKYGINANDVSITVLDSTATHTRGTVIMNGGNSRMFLAARGNGSYTIVYDGNGPILCSVVAPYDFPAYMANDCVQ